jgi:elongation of very long chain fatty acids protein 6
VPVCARAGSIYVVMVFSGQAWMASRPAFQLRGLLTCWSTFLAIFSMIGFARTLPEFIGSLTTGGLYKSICDPSFVDTNKVSGFWTWLFTLSKMPELGDTVFIVLRKQQLIFLHWYHHLTVLIYVFFCFSQFTSCARWFMVMNYFVHSLMYTYFALRAMRVRVPKFLAMMITSLQLIQMVVGFAVNYMAYYYKSNGRDCSVSDHNLMYGSIMYGSYFVLFARFFHNAYFSKSDRKATDKHDEKMVNGSTVKFENVIKSNRDFSTEGDMSNPAGVSRKQAEVDTVQGGDTRKRTGGVSSRDTVGRPGAEEGKKSN